MYAPNTVDTLETAKVRRAWPVAENFIADFSLPSAEERMIQTSDYRGLGSLVLLFVGECSPRTSCRLLVDLARHYTEIARESAEVLVVVRGTPVEAAQIKERDGLPFPVLADEDGQVHQDYGAVAQDGRSVCDAVYVAGRFGKLYLASRAGDGPPLPSAAGILGTLRFIEARCPLCGLDEPLL
ncbi:MAG TPA: redoxin domain-containing protein [Chloroflexia bacterium]|jgi:peroxiredoxin